MTTTSFHFENVGFLETKLSKEVMKRLNSYIEDRRESWNHRLIGNISGSYLLKDKNNWFFHNTILPAIERFNKDFPVRTNYIHPYLTKSCAFVLDTMWVNFQKKYEFNPLHDHHGVYSFVIWMKIPSDFEKESQIPIAKKSNRACANTFQFIYTTALGGLGTHIYRLSKKDEGTMLFFPARLNHVVYPFYLSNGYRVSVAGNISIDPLKVLNEGTGYVGNIIKDIDKVKND